MAGTNITVHLEYDEVVERLKAEGWVIPVRCWECKHTKTDGMDNPAIYCKKWDRWEIPSDFYCKYGERKGGEE